MNEQLHYGAPAKVLHWLVVTLLAVQFPIGWLMPDVHAGPPGLRALLNVNPQPHDPGRGAAGGRIADAAAGDCERGASRRHSPENRRPHRARLSSLPLKLSTQIQMRI